MFAIMVHSVGTAVESFRASLYKVVLFQLNCIYCFQVLNLSVVGKQHSNLRWLTVTLGTGTDFWRRAQKSRITLIMVFWGKNRVYRGVKRRAHTNLEGLDLSAAMPWPSNDESRRTERDLPAIFTTKPIQIGQAKSVLTFPPQKRAWDQVETDKHVDQEENDKSESPLVKQMQGHVLPDLRFFLREQNEIRRLYSASDVRGTQPESSMWTILYLEHSALCSKQWKLLVVCVAGRECLVIGC